MKRLCRMFSIDDEDWRKVPALAVVFETAAVVYLALEMVRTGRFTRQGAIEEACRRLGANSKTITSRLWRFGS